MWIASAGSRRSVTVRLRKVALMAVRKAAASMTAPLVARAWGGTVSDCSRVSRRSISSWRKAVR
jgi:hypothetical protein